jgi:hypothetical protein
MSTTGRAGFGRPRARTGAGPRSTCRVCPRQRLPLSGPSRECLRCSRRIQQVSYPPRPLTLPPSAWMLGGHRLRCVCDRKRGGTNSVTGPLREAPNGGVRCVDSQARVPARHARTNITNLWPIHLTGVARYGECSLCCCPHSNFTGAPQAPRRPRANRRARAVALERAPAGRPWRAFEQPYSG